MSFGKNLKTLRTQRKLTQKELAKKADIELAQVSRIETESSQPKLDTIRKLAIALECSTDELIFDLDDRELTIVSDSVLKNIAKLAPIPKACLMKIIASYCEYELANERYLEFEQNVFNDLMLQEAINKQNKEIIEAESE